ncbi:pyrroloquinoline quinone precursor peptide PqqA [Methylocystis sp.]|uniref:pyrroloquinoline quinone precursor peptide PqqA n=1 Tax=Methylocystis sp. TaxID=1911079 RepID=UPI003D0D0B5C
MICRSPSVGDRQSGNFGSVIEESLKLKPCASLISLDQSRRISRTANCRRKAMTWSQPTIVEICVGMEITSYESAEI